MIKSFIMCTLIATPAKTLNTGITKRPKSTHYRSAAMDACAWPLGEPFESRDFCRPAGSCYRARHTRFRSAVLGQLARYSLCVIFRRNQTRRQPRKHRGMARHPSLTSKDCATLRSSWSLSVRWLALRHQPPRTVFTGPDPAPLRGSTQQALAPITGS